jgi:hypothetical protein
MTEGIRLFKQILELKLVLLALAVELLYLVCNLVSTPEIQSFLCNQFSLLLLRVGSWVIIVLICYLVVS